MNESPSLGFLRRKFFPIYNHELVKFFVLSLIFLLISFDYALLRGLKDSFVLTKGGTNAISACKLWGVLPTFLLMNIVYGKISQRTGRIGRFNIVVAYFLLFFTFFLFFILPNRDSLQLHDFADRAKKLIPLASFHGLWNTIEYWPISLFYIHSEAWGTFVLSILFFTFVNEIVNTKQSGRFYPSLAISANLGAILAGIFLMWNSTPQKSLPVDSDASIAFTLLIVLINGLLIMLIYTYFARSISRNPLAYEVEEKKPSKKKVQLSIIDSFKVLFQSRYLLLIGFIVFAYAICINLLEAVYKDYLHEISKSLYENEIDQRNYTMRIMGIQLFLVGCSAIIFSIFLASPAMSLGWRFMGSVSPVMLLLNCTLFLFALYFGHYFGFIAKWFGVSVSFLTLFIGLVNVVLTKGSKYTFFDPFKENAYLPLTSEEKLFGKASVENLSRWGKASGAIFVTVVLNPLGGVRNWRLLIGGLILGIIIVWLGTVQSLTNRFYGLTKDSSSGQESKK